MERRNGDRVQSVARALSILEELAKDDRGLRLTDLSRKIGLSVTTVHRILTTLEERRFVQFSPLDNAWHVGIQAFAVGSAFSKEKNFVAPALPLLRHLRDKTHESVNLGVVEGGDIVIVTQVPSRQIARSVAGVGGRTPMTASGMGKAILSSYGRSSLHAVVRGSGMQRYTSTTLQSLEALEAQLNDIRKIGYAVDDGEFVSGVRCIAAPVYNERAEVVCAVSISGLSARIRPEHISALGQLVARSACQLTRTLGGKVSVH